MSSTNTEICDRTQSIVTTTPLLDASIRAQVAASGTMGQFTGCHYTRGEAISLTFQPKALQAALAEAMQDAV
ncbi:hypothetical protein CG51_17310 [Haematobacter missouriensis]|uniref:Uncharacterized protein n=1 Tax=Haematobacter missouriensis TaxID=366616 RepID=A0A212ANG7_9RHOB|nr:hypothetical protein CG51_17310 [Haematobacter missouriensis]OWJ73850.1 hypothetical protein CDV53_14870 [Haematobacter missouriensis]OWJ83015.1 hypothetical protein CDV52_13630 [Haematobacter missouriensis]